jgi:hypothetical protein
MKTLILFVLMSAIVTIAYLAVPAQSSTGAEAGQ